MDHRPKIFQNFPQNLAEYHKEVWMEFFVIVTKIVALFNVALVEFVRNAWRDTAIKNKCVISDY